MSVEIAVQQCARALHAVQYFTVQYGTWRRILVGEIMLSPIEYLPVGQSGDVDRLAD